MFWLAQNMQIRSHDFFLVAIDVPDKHKAGGTLIDYLGIFATSSPRDEVGIFAVHTKPIKDNVKVRFI